MRPVTSATRASGGSDKIRACPPTRYSPTTTAGSSVRRSPLAARARYWRWVTELAAHLDAGDELGAFLAPDGELDRRACSATGAGDSSTAAIIPSTTHTSTAASEGGGVARRATRTGTPAPWRYRP